MIFPGILKVVQHSQSPNASSRLIFPGGIDGIAAS